MVKKTKKPGKGKEKTERKTVKAEEKKARRETKKVSQEDDIDAILKSIQQEEAKKKEIHIEENVPAPSPRINCSMTINPLKDSELIFYGGEFYNGNKTFIYGDLYRYDVEKNEWKLISSPNSPPPRSSHQAIAWKDHLYIFGGEFTSPNQERFHHYKDLWMLDLKTNQWEQLLLKGCPSARSGHRMVLYKHKIVLFGGFYDTLREVRYLNDLFIFDLDSFKWQEIKPTPGCMWPSGRSGFQLFVYQDQIFLYGGYSKEITSGKNASEKGITHSDMWSLDPRTWEWNKVKRSGMPPGPRAGFSMCLHKKRAVLFGGVVDMEVGGDDLMSLFLNELYGFQIDCQRWYPLELRKDKPSKDKLIGSKNLENASNSSPNAMSHENIVEGSEDNMEFPEEGQYTQDDASNMSHAMSKNLSLGNNGNAKETHGSSVMQPCTSSEVGQAVKPCGRINACMGVGKDTLYLYGGMMEVKDREVTLDDLYTLNLSKLDEWKCIIPATMPEWIEVSDEDEDEDENEDEDDDSEAEDSNDESDSDDDADHGVIESGNIGQTTMDMENAVAILKGEKKNLRRKEKRARIEQIRATLSLSDSQRTPMPGESLKDFYKRTDMYWQMAAHEHTQHTGKELRKDGFDLAEARFRELKPILDEFAILEAEQKADEEEAEGSSGRKRGGDKKNKWQTSQR